jgi:hypothetical protein
MATCRNIRLITDFAGTGQVVRADMLASQMNQQLFRQGMVYDVKLDLEADSSQTVHVWALNPTWILKRSWILAKKMFDDNVKEEMAILPKSSRAKWRDFRVNDCLVGYGVAKPLVFETPAAASAATHDPVTAGRAEYNFSSVWTEEAESAYNFGLDSGASCFDIFEEYRRNWQVLEDPASSNDDDVPYDILNQDTIDASMQELKENGNLPPYDDMSGTAAYDRKWIYIGAVSTQVSGAQRLSTGFFEAPLGIVALQGYSGATFADANLKLVLKPGKYKGVSARRMEDL